MNLEKFFELVLSDPDNISILYSNINGKESLIVNGEDLTTEGEDYNDTAIKEKIADYKNKILNLNDYIFELVIEEAENRKYNLDAMNKGLELEHYTEADEEYANNVIDLMTKVIQDVITREINILVDTLERF